MNKKLIKKRIYLIVRKFQIRKVGLILIFLLLLISCQKNSGIYDDRLIKFGDAEKEIRNLFILKQIELLPGTELYLDFKLSFYSKCKRDIYIDKSDFRRCISNLAVTPVNAKNPSQLFNHFQFFIENNCDLRKEIMFNNSIWGGELNFCEFDY